MPTPKYENQVFLIWENNPKTPITAAALSKAGNYIASYQDFDVSDLMGVDPHKENSILMVDTFSSAPDYLNRLIMKRQVSIGIINTNKDLLGNFYVDVNDQYKYFDVGLEDLYITTADIDDGNNPLVGANKVWSRSGELRQWFVYLCDNEDSSTAKILCSQSLDHPTGQPMGSGGASKSPLFTKENTRMIGGFKTKADGTIDPNSLWDISGKINTVRSKKYMILDEYANDLEDTGNIIVQGTIQKRFIYRPLRPNDLDSTTVATVFGNNLSVTGTITSSGNISIGGNLSIAGTTQVTGKFDVGATLPIHQVNLNYDGSLTALTYRVPHTGSFQFINAVTPTIITSLVATPPTASRAYTFPDASSDGTVLIAASSQSSGFFDVSATLPQHSPNINYDGQLTATQHRTPYYGAFSFVNAISPTIYTSITAVPPTSTRTYQFLDIGSNGSIMVAATSPNPGFFDSTTTNPSDVSSRINFDGKFYSSAIYVTGNVTTTSPNTMSIQAASEVVVTGAVATGGQFRAIGGNYGTILRNDGTNFQLLTTNSGDQYGTWNAFRPLSFSLATGVTTITSLQTDTISAPSGTLSVTGNLRVTSTTITAGTFNSGTTAPTNTTRLNYEGYFYATKVYNAVWNDLAEYFKASDVSKPGKVYVIENGRASLSYKRADKRVLGVCSDSAAYIMKSEYQKDGVLIGLSGTLDVWTKSKLKAGDELVSDYDGFATRANWFEKIFKRGAILGKSLLSKIDNSEQRIPILIRS
jgi:hypothetical protein